MSTSTFKGGIHPKYNKQLSSNQAIAPLDAPKELVIPLSQHIGAPAKALVSKGDEVLMGQVIAEAGGFVSAPIHSSVSGKVTAIEPRLGAMGPTVMSIIIENDGQDKTVPFTELSDWNTTDPAKLKSRIHDAGLVGMGGAAFPTHVKLSPPADKPIDTLLLNGAECEPYLTADHRTMIERAEEIIEGALIAQKILNARKCAIGIEINKPDAIEAVKKASKDNDIEIVPLKVKYPQGAEKQLIDAYLQREVPSGGLPMDVGVVVQNVGTCAAIYDAVVKGKPLIERVVTITGTPVAKPANLLIRIGTPISCALEVCEADLEKTGKLILGGPMMGFSQFSTSPPVTKGTSGILLLDNDAVDTRPPLPCIRCGRCLTICPMRVTAADISRYCSKQMFAEAEKADALDCIECGSCSHNCPSRIPLVQQIRLAKATILENKRNNSSKGNP